MILLKKTVSIQKEKLNSSIGRGSLCRLHYQFLLRAMSNISLSLVVLYRNIS